MLYLCELCALSGEILGAEMIEIKEGNGGVLLPVKVVPGSSRPGIKGELGGRLKVALAAPPEKGKANKELCSLLASRLGIKRPNVTIQSGHGSPLKTVLIAGLPATVVLEKLAGKTGVDRITG